MIEIFIAPMHLLQDIHIIMKIINIRVAFFMRTEGVPQEQGYRSRRTRDNDE